MSNTHNEPTYANQLWHARKMLREQGHNALDNPHGMIGRECRCGECFCCAAAEVLSAPHVAKGQSGYDLYFRGERVITGESFTVCDQVLASLERASYQGEAGEVAQRIAGAVKGN